MSTEKASFCLAPKSRAAFRRARHAEDSSRRKMPAGAPVMTVTLWPSSRSMRTTCQGSQVSLLVCLHLWAQLDDLGLPGGRRLMGRSFWIVIMLEQTQKPQRPR